nr:MULTISPECIES: hypothetical protein [Aquimarina]
MLLEIFEEYNKKVNKLIVSDFAAGIAERYRTAKSMYLNIFKNFVLFDLEDLNSIKV